MFTIKYSLTLQNFKGNNPEQTKVPTSYQIYIELPFFRRKKDCSNIVTYLEIFSCHLLKNSKYFHYHIHVTKDIGDGFIGNNKWGDELISNPYCVTSWSRDILYFPRKYSEIVQEVETYNLSQEKSACSIQLLKGQRKQVLHHLIRIHKYILQIMQQPNFRKVAKYEKMWQDSFVQYAFHALLNPAGQ